MEIVTSMRGVRVDEMNGDQRLSEADASAGLALFELGDQAECATAYWQQNPADFPQHRADLAWLQLQRSVIAFG